MQENLQLHIVSNEETMPEEKKIITLYLAFLTLFFLHVHYWSLLEEAYQGGCIFVLASAVILLFYFPSFQTNRLNT